MLPLASPLLNMDVLDVCIVLMCMVHLQEVQMLIKDLAFDTGLVRSERALKPADPGRDDV